MIRKTLVCATLLAIASASQAGEVYGGLGLPGAMLGYAHPLNEKVTLRGDFSTLGSMNKDYDESGVKYQGHLKANRGAVFADWFPFQGGFRLTGGVTFNDFKVNLNAQGNGNSITLGSTTYTFGADDRFDVEIKFPRTTPYLGLGYGHQMGNGIGFVFDLGASIGKASLSETHSGTNLSQANQADIDRELQQLRDGVGKVRAIPQLSLGMSYRF